MGGGGIGLQEVCLYPFFSRRPTSCVQTPNPEMRYPKTEGSHATTHARLPRLSLQTRSMVALRSSWRYAVGGSGTLVLESVWYIGPNDYLYRFDVYLRHMVLWQYRKWDQDIVKFEPLRKAVRWTLRAWQAEFVLTLQCCWIVCC